MSGPAEEVLGRDHVRGAVNGFDEVVLGARGGADTTTSSTR